MDAMSWLDRFRGGAVPGVQMSEVLPLLAKGAVLVDVRSLREYERGHAPGSKHVDAGSLTGDRDAMLDAVFGDDPLANRDAMLIVMAAIPPQAGQAVMRLQAAGIDARPLAGGLTAWVRDGQPLVPGPPR
jgi:rhodanese-related sulfurtransferase